MKQVEASVPQVRGRGGGWASGMMSFTQRLEQSRSILLTGIHVLRCESSSPAGRFLSLYVRMLVFQSVSDVAHNMLLKCAADINQMWIIGLL